MSTTHTRTNFATAVVGAAIATVAAPALLFLGVGTAQAIHDSETVAVQDIERKPNITIGGFNPQPDPPGFPDNGSTVGIIVDGGGKVGLGAPDTRLTSGP